MRWLLVLLIHACCLGLPLLLVFSASPRQHKTRPALPLAEGLWSLHWESSLALASDPFALSDEAALRISLDGQRWERQTLAAHSQGSVELPDLRLRLQPITVYALPEAGQPAGALRLRLLRDQEEMAEQVWWIEAGSPLSAGWDIDIPRLERQRGR